MKHRPSSLPMLAQCSDFESSGSDFADLGTDRHAALRAHYNGDDSLLTLLDEEDQEGVKWAADFIRANSTDSYSMEWETKRAWSRPDFSEAQGTPDLVNGSIIFDFKWRQRDYAAQMADYALSVIEKGFERVTVFLLFGCERRAVKLFFDAAACDAVLIPLLKRAETPTPTPCDYCGWCAKQFTCKAKTGPAKVVAEGYAESDMLQVIKDWHPSEMLGNADQISFALTIWRKVLKKWGESVEFHAMEAATKQGLKLPGFELKERQGRKFVADTQRAYELSGLPPEKFLQACAVRLNTTKTNPLPGLDKLFAEAFGLKMAPAKREAEKKLAEVIQRAKSTLSLVGAEDDGGDEE
jgi:hypothetical protein